MFKLKVRRNFAAAHKLLNYSGSCAFLHGHTWTVEVAVKGEGLDDCGMLVDFKELKNLVDDIIKPFDHSYLNELEVFCEKNPTAENLACYVFYKMKEKIAELQLNIKIFKVEIWESPEASASYQEE